VPIKKNRGYLLNLQEKFIKKEILLMNLSKLMRFLTLLAKLKQKKFKEGWNQADSSFDAILLLHRAGALRQTLTFEEHDMKTYSFKTLVAGFALLAVLAGCTSAPRHSTEATAAPVAPHPVSQSRDAGPAGAPEGAATMISPMMEKRETFTATGYAVISVQNHKNPAQQRLLAIRASKLDAYRSLTEQVYGQYLDATTTVAEMTVMNDTFRTRVEGVIYGAQLVSITPIGEDTYEATMSLDKNVVRDLRALYLSQIAQRAH